MNKYLEDTEYAVNGLIYLINFENEKLKKAEALYQMFQNETKKNI